MCKTGNCSHSMSNDTPCPAACRCFAHPSHLSEARYITIIMSYHFLCLSLMTYFIVDHLIVNYHLPRANRCDQFNTSVLRVINLIELEAVLVEAIQANELVVFVLICSLFVVSWCRLKSVKPGFYVPEETIHVKWRKWKLMCMLKLQVLNKFCDNSNTQHTTTNSLPVHCKKLLQVLGKGKIHTTVLWFVGFTTVIYREISTLGNCSM